MTASQKLVARGSVGFAAGLLFVLAQGCTTVNTPYDYYFQRAPIRVVVMPSGNTTEHPDAPIIFNKACEDALTKKGFVVIRADRVVTYAAERGVLLNDVTKFKASDLGRDLKADMVLYSEIRTWESSYAVLNTRVQVAGTSRLVETATDSLVWYYAWNIAKDSSSNNNGVLGLLVNAAVDVVANSAFDACSSLGAQAGAQTIYSLPEPGFAPSGSLPRQTGH